MVYDYYKEMKSRKGNKKIYVIAGLVLAFILLSIVSSIYLEVIQLKEIGDFDTVFWTNFAYKAIFASIVFVIIFLAIFITNIQIKKNFEKYFKGLDGKLNKVYNIPVALLIALVGAFFSKEAFFERGLMYLNRVNFETVDPVFGLDIGYFLFSRPFLMTVYEFFSSLMIFLIIYTVVYYILLGVGSVDKIVLKSLNLDNSSLKPFFRHNLVNIALFFFIRTFSYRFRGEGLVYSTFENVRGAGYVDVNIWLNFFKVIPFILMALVVIALVSLYKGKIKRSVTTILVYPAVWILVSLIASGVQFFMVTPNVSSYEGPFIGNNIAMTKLAFGLDQIKSVDFPDIQELTPDVLERNQQTVDNIRIIDYSSTLANNRQVQSLRNYYTFRHGSIVNFPRDGENIPAFIAAREMERENLPDKTYLSTRFRYTHGFGVVVNPLNEISNQGQVRFIIGDLEDGNENLENPAIYYGLLSDDYVYTNAQGLDEINYDGTASVRYQGDGGLLMTPLNRLLFSIYYGDYQMLVSRHINNQTRLLLNREVVNRARMALPFLKIDDDPYIMISDEGRLKWVVDGYTTSNSFPYSQSVRDFRFGEYNYIRNSVKILVDAYDGTVECYVIDREDPVIKVYKNIYPQAFAEGELPLDVRNYMKYPEYLFNVQTRLLRRYHLGEDEVGKFFSNTDLWEISKTLGSQNSNVVDIEPFYNMIRLPGEISDSEEFILMRPFSPSGDRNNMVSWLAARNSYENYGEMVLFQFSRDSNVLGPQQVGVTIDQDDEISSATTLWGQSGSSVYKGSLLVIPIEESILYIQPIYVRAETGSSIPEVRRIIAGFQKDGQFVFGAGQMLETALENMFESAKRGEVIIDDIPEPDLDKEIQDEQEQELELEDDHEREIEEMINGDLENILNQISNRFDSIKTDLDSLEKLIEDLDLR